MDSNNSYFYLSGLISLTLFILFLSLFVFMMIQSDKVKHFALKKDNYISVSIDIVSAKNSLKSQSKQSASTPTEKDDVNIDNLFDSVWTQGTERKKETVEKVDNRRILDIQRKISKASENKVESITEKFKNIVKSENDSKDSKASTASEVNEYLAKIQALVYEHFYPPQNSQGNSVKAVIELSSIGKVNDFRILTYSSNSELNRECDKIKQRLMSVVFPVHPDNVSGRYTITLISKE